MRQIGITYHPTASLFYSGLNQTSLLFADLFSNLGYDVTLVDSKNSDTKMDYPVVYKTSNLYQTNGLDILFDVDGFVSPENRKRAKKTIVFFRTFLQFAEMDASVYLENDYFPRSMENVEEIWCWDVLNPLETIPSIQTLFPCPIKTVPFIWSSKVAEHYMKKRELIAPNKDSKWTIHVAEKNTNTSSPIFPLVAIRELCKSVNATYKIHNMKENKFFKENVSIPLELDTLPVEFLSKEPYYEWTKPNTVLFSHSRFVSLRIGLLNALFMGIPLIHNSPFLKGIHPVLSSMYYTGNSISEIKNVFRAFTKNPNMWEIDTIRAVIEKGTKPNMDEWSVICKDAFLENSIENKVVKSKKIVIAFESMWPGFNYDTNFICDAMRTYAICNENIDIKGVPYSEKEEPNVLIFGPYNDNWKKVAEHIPKVYFSAENWTNPTDPQIKLFLTSSMEENEKNMRIPTWMTFIDWFSGSTELPTNHTDNPIRIPVHFAMTPHKRKFAERDEFCAFVVSNPSCPFRNDTFQIMNKYKKVNSGGQLFNNIEKPLAMLYPGGGCGDISKYHFFTNHKFTLSFENSQSPGYITEKVLHAKMAGCVPLYWGDVNTSDVNTSDFNPNSFINVSNAKNSSTVVEVIKKLEANPEICDKIASTPILNEEKKKKALEILSCMSRKLFSLAMDTNTMYTKDTNTKDTNTKDTIEGIEKTFVINLDTRRDRWDKLMKAEPYLEDQVTRIAAVHGKSLKMSKVIYDLFNKNQFQWKKSVIGCNLSHISVWTKIAMSTGKYYLVLEDDVRFVKGWLTKWKEALSHIPNDADLLYLGGVLPPNKPALPLVTAQYNEHWSYIKPNTLFSQTPVAVFHFCAYSYILTPRGAQKLINHLANSDTKSFTVSDHLLGHPSVGLVKYFTNPLLSYCFQEEDPNYVNSQFNDLHRKDNFDSDLWNNTECFTEEELEPFCNDLKDTKEQKEQKERDTLEVYCMSSDGIYEQTWLEDIMNVNIKYKSIFDSEIFNNSWYLVQKPHIDKFNDVFTRLNNVNYNFKVIHISDEFASDNISFYELPGCKAVIRNYVRNIPNLPHIYTIPLGYHHKYTNTLKSWEERELMWSFHGTNWFNRDVQLKSFMKYEPYSCTLQPSWNHSTAIKESTYLSLLGNSKFCPVLKGNNMETFRLYEALEAGTLPIATSKNAYTEWIDEKMDLSSLYEWTNPDVMNTKISNDVYEKVLYRWKEWKDRIKYSIKTMQ